MTATIPVAVIGAGYVGLVQAVGLASKGVSVILADRDTERVERIRSGDPVIHEASLSELLSEALAGGQLTVTTSNIEAVTGAGVTFLALPTPSHPDGKADLRVVNSVVDEITPHLSAGSVLAVKSTVPVGTCDALVDRVRSLGSQVDVVSNPEFLREGTAVHQFLHPDRIVLGGESNARGTVAKVYEGFEAPMVLTSRSSAEMIKYTSNAILALRISFVNEIAELTRRTGGNFDEVALGLSLDPRIGKGFLSPGPGWGGSCFPKDTRALLHSARESELRLRTVEAAIDSNAATQRRIVDRLSHAVGGLGGKHIALWGIAFKAGTDDVRDSPALLIADLIEREGAAVVAYDPIARSRLVRSVDSALDAVKGADALLVATEWPEFSDIDPRPLADLMRGKTVLDTRGVLDTTLWASVGFEVV